MTAERGAASAPHARRAVADPRRTDRGPPSARRADRRSRCIGLRTTAPCPAAAGPSTASTISSSIAASSARLPGKNREIIAKPCAMVVAVDGCRVRGATSPVSRLTRMADAPWPRTAQSSSRQMLLDERNLRLHRQLDVGQACAGPGPGATPVRIQAGRFWYIRPRVPSIGSTMITHRAALTVGALRHDDLAARQPLGHQHDRRLPCRDRSPISSMSTCSATRSIA